MTKERRPTEEQSQDEKSYKNPYLLLKRESNPIPKEVNLNREVHEPAIIGRDSQLAIKNIKVYQPLQHSPVREPPIFGEFRQSAASAQHIS